MLQKKYLVFSCNILIVMVHNGIRSREQIG